MITLQNTNEFNIKSVSPIVYFAYRGHEDNPINTYYFCRGRHQNYDYADIIAKDLTLSGNLHLNYQILNDDDKYIKIMCGDDGSDSPFIFLNGNNGNGSNEKGKIVICAQDLTSMNESTFLTLYPDGRFQLRSHGMPSTMDIRAAGIIRQSINLNGYIKYASGLILQWGRTKIADTSLIQGVYIKQISLPISFSDNQYSVVLTKNSIDKIAGAQAIYMSSFNIVCESDMTNSTYYWFAIGY